MNKQKIAELRAGLETGFINSGYNSSLAYQPQFLSNNHKEGKKVLSSIEDELMSCDKFQIKDEDLLLQSKCAVPESRDRGGT